MRNIKLIIEYDGKGFNGWQKQPNKLNIQGEIERAIEEITGESIDLIARVLVKYYLNPKGTSIYNGEIAAGTYYTTPTLTGVNNKYATDKNWANAVYSHMKYLYNKL